jgi:hypothetical protein
MMPENDSRLPMSQASKASFVAFITSVLLTAAGSTGCGGDGSGPSRPPPPRPGAVFRGNLAAVTVQRALQSLQVASASRAHANPQDPGVEVCVDGTVFCSVTDSNGTFVLVARTHRNVVLLFAAGDFNARLRLTDILPGSVVTLHDIECSTDTARCTPRQMDVESP